LQAAVAVHLLTYFSIANAVYTYSRKRHYRLFESSIDAPQSTPSARRVRVDSSPVASSPLRFLTSILGDTSAESRAHADPTRDVWELAVWDPLPICLRLFCFFSPGHVLVYWLFLPTLTSDPRPSVTVFTTIILEILLSSQLFLLQSAFSQQEKDSAIIHKEVMNEYDIKYVHPRLNPLVRDVSTQFAGPDCEGRSDECDVETYTPTQMTPNTLILTILRGHLGGRFHLRQQYIAHENQLLLQVQHHDLPCDSLSFDRVCLGPSLQVPAQAMGAA
jgi:hypothetical protein